jgi:ribulose-phosphate 3-epimerase
LAIVAPSILAADWSNLGREISAVADAGADWIHLDIMDGHFVPPITFGPPVVKAAKQHCNLPLDVHLMIERPDDQLDAFIEAGADYVTVHAEACKHLHRTVQRIHELGAKAGVALNPATPVASLEDIISDVDLILIMTVNPGWGGQTFIESCQDKISQAAEAISDSNRDIQLEVDGGVNDKTAELCISAGANVLVAGTYVFGSDDYKSRITSLKKTVSS